MGHVWGPWACRGLRGGQEGSGGLIEAKWVQSKMAQGSNEVNWGQVRTWGGHLRSTGLKNMA